jgi:hypothetical protein
LKTKLSATAERCVKDKTKSLNYTRHCLNILLGAGDFLFRQQPSPKSREKSPETFSTKHVTKKFEVRQQKSLTKKKIKVQKVLRYILLRSTTLSHARNTLKSVE